MEWSNTDGEYEWNAAQDWAKFKDEVLTLARKGLTVKQIMDETGGDYSDVRHALATEGMT